MSLNIITFRDDFIILTSDRRACLIDRKNIGGVETELVFCFDGDRKSYFFHAPHNFVGFSINGWEIIEINELVQDFEDSLPNALLSIREYAEKLSEFFGKRYSAKVKGLSLVSDPLKFNIAGFDKDG